MAVKGAVVAASSGPDEQAGTAVKDEPQEDTSKAARKKDKKTLDVSGKDKEAAKIAPKEKKEEGGGDEEPREEEDIVAPEAEPSFPRNEVPPGTTKFRQDAVHVYGLDFLKTGHMEEIFGQFNHRYVEWINDSSANVVFKNLDSARRALESLSYPKVGDDPWRRTPDILVHDDLPAVFLQMRLAAPSDVKKGKRAIPSANPPTYIEESQRGNPQFSVASLYPRSSKPQPTGREPRKRAAQGPPDEEFDKRKRRSVRFEATLGTPPTAPTAVELAQENGGEASEKSDAPEAKSGKEAKNKEDEDVEDKQEEEARRQKRAERFGGASTTTESVAAPAETPAASPGEAENSAAAKEAEAGK
jgi:hypothetical protein